MKGVDYLVKFLNMDEINYRYKFIKAFKVFGIDCDPSTTPWCAAAINMAERAVGNKGTGKLNARSFLDYGTEVPLKDARLGDICVFKRGLSLWQGHVTYFIRDNGDGTIQCLGGNQGDRVCYNNYSASKLLGIRRP